MKIVRRLLPGPFLDYQARQETLRHWADYRAAVGFLESLETKVIRRFEESWDESAS